MQYLYLGGNNLTKSENLEWLSHMSSIEDLDLSFTNLSVANDWLEVVSSLPNLKTSYMTACNLPPISLYLFPNSIVQNPSLLLKVYNSVIMNLWPVWKFREGGE